MASTAEEKYEVITRRLQEVLGGDSIKAILAEGRTPKCYWGKQLIPDLLRARVLIVLIFRNCTYGSPYVTRHLFYVHR